MGKLKYFFLTKLKASSITEVIVASAILVIVFTIAITTLSTIITSTVQNDTSKMETEIQQLIYQYTHKQLKTPTTYQQEEYMISVQKFTQNKLPMVAFLVVNSHSKKRSSQKWLAHEN